VTGLVLVLGLLAIASCGSSKPEEAPVSGTPTAKVENAAGAEDTLARIVLAGEAEQRLGIAVVPVERRSLPRRRRTGGDVVVPMRLPASGGRAVVVGPALGAADRLRAADTLLAADEAVARARVDVQMANATLARAERVLRAEATSVRSVEEARARLAAAKVTLETAEARRKTLAEATFGGGDSVWIRVPVWAGDVPRVARARPAMVAGLGESPGAVGRVATPVDGPRAGNADAATVDLFYAVDNRDGALQSGERVVVTLELQEADDMLVAPWSAIVVDVHGGEWLYEQVAPHTFVRRRVQVRWVVDESAALASGPPPGTTVVASGAAELFGVEFGAGK